MTDIHTELNNVKSLSELYSFIKDDPIESKVGFLSGRKFIKKGAEGELTLNDLVIKFKNLSDKTNDQESTLGIIRKLQHLDNDADKKLKDKNIITRIFTFIRGCHPIIVSNQLNERDSVIFDIGKKLEGEKKAIFITEWIFPHIENYKEVKRQLTRCFEDPSKDNNSKLIDEIKLKNSDYLIETLIRKFSEDKDVVLKDKIAPFLVACYAHAKECKISDKTILNIQEPERKYNDLDFTWRIKNNKKLLDEAERQYNNIKFQEDLT